MSKILLAAVLVLFAVMFASVALATNPAPVVVPVIVKPVVVAPVVVPVPPPVVVPAPPPPSVAVPPPSPTVQPQPSGGGSGPGAMGWAVMGGVIVYFWAVVCIVEKRDYPNGWFAKHMCFRD